MLRWLARRRAGLKAGLNTFDPSGLDDPVATRTRWGPANLGGSNFRTRRLVSTGSLRLEYRATPSALAFYSLFIFVAVGVGLSLLGRGPSGRPVLVPLGIATALGVLGMAALYVGAAPIVFDKAIGSFSKLWVAPFERQVALGVPTDLKDIHALQLIPEYVTEDETSFYSFELNVVLRDGKRLNIVDHSGLETLREEARELAAFLRKPLWDAVQ